jgi:hypothetical protein
LFSLLRTRISGAQQKTAGRETLPASGAKGRRITMRPENVACAQQRYDALRGGAFVPGIGMNDVAVFVGPGDFFVAQLNLFQVVVLLVAGSLMSCIRGFTFTTFTFSVWC